MYITADVIANMCAPTDHRKPLCVIDAGDGKGYLSTRLSLEHKIKVLGVDCNPTNVTGALKRSKLLEVKLENFFFSRRKILSEFFFLASMENSQRSR